MNSNAVYNNMCNGGPDNGYFSHQTPYAGNLNAESQVFYPQTGNLQNSSSNHFYNGGTMVTPTVPSRMEHHRTPPLHPTAMDASTGQQIIDENNGCCYTQLVTPEYANNGGGYRAVPQGPAHHGGAQHHLDYGSQNTLHHGIAPVTATSIDTNNYHHRELEYPQSKINNGQVILHNTKGLTSNVNSYSYFEQNPIPPIPRHEALGVVYEDIPSGVCGGVTSQMSVNQQSNSCALPSNQVYQWMRVKRNIPKPG